MNMNEPSSLQRNREQQRNKNKGRNKRGRWDGVGAGVGGMSSSAPSASNRRKRKQCPSSSSPSSPPIAEGTSLSTIFAAARTRRFSVVELIYLLSPETTPLTISASPPQNRPPSGALFLYNRSITRNYKDDGHEWLKKRVSSKCSRWKVREDDVKLRLNRECRVKAWYARSSSIPTLRRRSYYLLDPSDSTQQLHDLVLVHYLDTEGGATEPGNDNGKCDGLPADDGNCAASKIETAASRLPTDPPSASSCTVTRGSPATCLKEKQSLLYERNGRSDLHSEDPHCRVDTGRFGQVESDITTLLTSGVSSAKRDKVFLDNRVLAGLSASSTSAPNVADRRLSGAAVSRDKAILDKLLHGANGTLSGTVVSPRVSVAANLAQPVAPPLAAVALRSIAGGGVVGLDRLDGHAETGVDRRLSLETSPPSHMNTERRHSLAASSAQLSIADRRLSLAASSAQDVAERRVSLTSLGEQANDVKRPALPVSSADPEIRKDPTCWSPKSPPFPHEKVGAEISKAASGSMAILAGAAQATKECSSNLGCIKGKQKHYFEDSVLSPATLAGHMNSPFFKIVSEQASIQVAPRITDEELAREWEMLTEKERNQAVADIYGNEVVEDSSAAHGSLSQFLSMAKNESQALRLTLMDQEVDKMPSQAKSCLFQAMQHCPELVTSIHLKLHFLRCEDYSPRLAARRLVNYWAKRVETFGVDRAFLPLTLEGAMADDYDELAKGYTRLLPGTDASGRGILFVDNSRKCSFVTQTRSLWYMAHAALENESVLRNGIVVVIYRSPPVEIIKTEFIMERQRLFRDILPFRLRVVHHCQFHPNSWLTRAGQFTAGKYMRTRVMSQEGSTEEVLLKLAECGISRSQLPTELGGTITDADFQEWLAARRHSS